MKQWSKISIKEENIRICTNTNLYKYALGRNIYSHMHHYANIVLIIPITIWKFLHKLNIRCMKYGVFNARSYNSLNLLPKLYKSAFWFKKKLKI